MNKKILFGIIAATTIGSSGIGIIANTKSNFVTRAENPEGWIRFDSKTNTNFLDSMNTSAQTVGGYNVTCCFFPNQTQTYSFGTKETVDSEEERWFVGKDYSSFEVTGAAKFYFYVKGATCVEIHTDCSNYSIYAIDENYTNNLCRATNDIFDTVFLSLEEGHTINGVCVELPYTNNQLHFIDYLTVFYNVSDCREISQA